MHWHMLSHAPSISKVMCTYWQVFGLHGNDRILFRNSRALLPTFCTYCPDGFHFAHMGSHFAQNTIQTPVLYSAVTHPFQGYASTQNTPKPTIKHPCSWPELERGQNELSSGMYCLCIVWYVLFLICIASIGMYWYVLIFDMCRDQYVSVCICMYCTYGMYCTYS